MTARIIAGALILVVPALLSGGWVLWDTRRAQRRIGQGRRR